MTTLQEELSDLQGEQVVIDTKSPYLYIGVLEEVREQTLLLKEVDVHDSGESSASKELYIIQSVKAGIRKNRERVQLLLREVVSLSRLSDVVQY